MHVCAEANIVLHVLPCARCFLIRTVCLQTLHNSVVLNCVANLVCKFANFVGRHTRSTCGCPVAALMVRICIIGSYFCKFAEFFFQMCKTWFDILQVQFADSSIWCGAHAMGLCSKLAKWVCACGSLVCQFGTVVIKFAKMVVWICAVHCRRSALVEFATLHTWFCYEASACLLLPICKTNVSLCLHKGVLASIANLVCMFVKSVCVAQFFGNKACFIVSWKQNQKKTQIRIANFAKLCFCVSAVV